MSTLLFLLLTVYGAITEGGHADKCTQVTITDQGRGDVELGIHSKKPIKAVSLTCSKNGQKNSCPATLDGTREQASNQCGGECSEVTVEDCSTTKQGDLYQASCRLKVPESAGSRSFDFCPATKQ